MRERVYRAIGVKILKAEGSLIDVDDFAPLLVPTGRLLEGIVQNGGPAIDHSAVKKGRRELTLAALDGVMILCQCMTEETADLRESSLLLQARRSELSRAFKYTMEGQNLTLAGDPRAIKAVFLLAAAFEIAHQLETTGRGSRGLYGFSFEAAHLCVRERDGELQIEKFPALIATRNSLHVRH